MPGIPHYEVMDDNDDVDEALAWVGILALFSEMNHEQRTRFIRHMGAELYQLRNTDIRHLESRERVLSRIVMRQAQTEQAEV